MMWATVRIVVAVLLWCGGTLGVGIATGATFDAGTVTAVLAGSLAADVWLALAPARAAQ